MEDRRYHILRKENGKSLIWLECAADLDRPKSRVKGLISFWLGEHQIFDAHTKEMVLNMAGPVATPPPK